MSSADIEWVGGSDPVTELNDYLTDREIAQQNLVGHIILVRQSKGEIAHPWTQIIDCSTDRVGSLRFTCKEWARFIRSTTKDSSRRSIEYSMVDGKWTWFMKHPRDSEYTVTDGERSTIRLVARSSGGYYVAFNGGKTQRGVPYISRDTFPIDPRPVPLTPALYRSLPMNAVVVCEDKLLMRKRPLCVVRHRFNVFSYIEPHASFSEVLTVYVVPTMDEYVMK